MLEYFQQRYMIDLSIFNRDIWSSNPKSLLSGSLQKFSISCYKIYFYSFFLSNVLITIDSQIQKLIYLFNGNLKYSLGKPTCFLVAFIVKDLWGSEEQLGRAPPHAHSLALNMNMKPWVGAVIFIDPYRKAPGNSKKCQSWYPRFWLITIISKPI